MEKTAKQIERDMYRIIKNSGFKTAIAGKIYRKGMRPKNATTEDIVVKFLSGTDGQMQEGVVLVHIYVPNIAVHEDGELYEDITRVETLQGMINDLISGLQDSEYWFEKDGTPNSFPVEGIEQHFINVRLHYKRITF